MSYVLRIKPVSSKSKIDVLREFGHRVFVELGESDKPTGFFVETQETAGIAATAPRSGRRTAVTGNVALVWAGKQLFVKKKDSIFAKVALAVQDYANVPVRRQELVEAIEADGKFEGNQVTNAISRLTLSGHLVVPG